MASVSVNVVELSVSSTRAGMSNSRPACSKITHDERPKIHVKLILVNSCFIFQLLVNNAEMGFSLTSVCSAEQQKTRNFGFKVLTAEITKMSVF